MGLVGLLIMYAPLDSLETTILGEPIAVDISYETYWTGRELDIENIQRYVNITILRDVSILEISINYIDFIVFINPEGYSVLHDFRNPVILNTQGVPSPDGIFRLSIHNKHCKSPCNSMSYWMASVVWNDIDGNSFYANYEQIECLAQFRQSDSCLLRDSCFLKGTCPETNPLSITIKADDLIIEKNFEK